VGVEQVAVEVGAARVGRREREAHEWTDSGRARTIGHGRDPGASRDPPDRASGSDGGDRTLATVAHDRRAVARGKCENRRTIGHPDRSAAVPYRGASILPRDLNRPTRRGSVCPRRRLEVRIGWGWVVVSPSPARQTKTPSPGSLLRSIADLSPTVWGRGDGAGHLVSVQGRAVGSPRPHRVGGEVAGVSDANDGG